MDIQSIIVYIILACVAFLIIRHIYRQFTGKNRHCQCDSCPMRPDEDCHCEDCATNTQKESCPHCR